jgi:hypothetical protein
MVAPHRSAVRLLVVVAVTVTALAVAAADLPPGGTFLDDDLSVHEGSIEAIAAAGITLGCNPPANTNFCPRDSVTRAQMAAFLVRALGLPPVASSPFTDVEGIFTDDINRLAAAGITRGCNPPANTEFCPKKAVTREQMAAFLTRALSLPPTTVAPFADVSGTFLDDINRLAAAGITLGCNPPDNTRFCPSNLVTREQMASFLTRGLGLTPIVPEPRPGPPTGNPDGNATVPAAGREVDTSSRDIVIGNGLPSSCTSAAVVAAVAQGGIITFDCGPDPVTIEMLETAKVFNDTGPEIVIDGGGKVTLSGRGQNRILYMNTCDQAQVWTTSHCQNQDHPQLTVQNLTFVDGNSKGETTYDGGGAIWVRGGRFKVVNSRFFNNVCADVGPDVGGAAIRVFSQYQGMPVYVVNSTFGGGEEYGNVCSNGGGLSSIGVSYTVINSLFTHNLAIGDGANPAQGGTPGGGSGGAIYNDGNTFTLTIIDTVIEDNHANEGGGAIFFVSNDRSGTLRIEDSTLRRNPSDGFETRGFPGIFYLGNGPPQVINSTIDD